VIHFGNEPETQDWLAYEIDMHGELLKQALVPWANKPVATASSIAVANASCTGAATAADEAAAASGWQQVSVFECINGLIQIGTKKFRCGHRHVPRRSNTIPQVCHTIASLSPSSRWSPSLSLNL